MTKKAFALTVFIIILALTIQGSELFVQPQSLQYGTETIFIKEISLVFAENIPEYIQANYQTNIGSFRVEVTLDRQKELEGKGDEAFIIKLENGSGLISANSLRGLVYALDAFKTITSNKESINEFILLDWPDYPLRGIIEGFYGPPWSHEDRLSIIRFMGQTRMNTYVYAPKDDPYHRMQWKDPYPKGQKERLQELVKEAEANNVDFIFAISPGNSLKFTSEEDWQALIDKTEDMISIGIKKFSLLFDDINPTLKFKDDRVYYKNNYGLAHIEWSNRYQEYLREKLPGSRLIVVGTDYYQEGTSRYRNQFAEMLDQDVLVFSTGYGVVAQRITKGHAKEIASAWGHEIVYWDNYPVNDYVRNRLYMGPLSGREPLLPNTYGFTFNPMNEAELSKVALMTAASYTWNSKNYNPMQSWETAIKILGGSNWQTLRRFAINSVTGLPGGATTNYPEMWELVTRFNYALNNYKEASESERLELEKEFYDALFAIKTEFELLSQLEVDFATYFPRAYLEAEGYLKRLSNVGCLGFYSLKAIEDIIFAKGTEADVYLKEAKDARGYDKNLSSVEPSSIADLIIIANSFYREAVSMQQEK